METTITSAPVAPAYPVMMINVGRNLIVMFTDHGIGMVIACDNASYAPGEYVGDWVMSDFTPFTGIVTIQTVNGK